MNEANDEANVEAANWEKLLAEFVQMKLRGVIHVKLTDREADNYDFGNEILMRTMRNRLVEALQDSASRAPFSYLTLGNKFFATMNDQQQRDFFRSIFNLPLLSITLGEVTADDAEKPAISILTLALLDALADLNSYVRILQVSNFALSNKSDVERLSNIIIAKPETLEDIYFEGIECPVDNNKRDREEPIGFLDPLLYAASRLEYFDSFGLSARAPPLHSSLVSPEAVRALLSAINGRTFDYLGLRGFGLNDSHVIVIAEGLLSTPDTALSVLNLGSNPAISAEGYVALLDLINRVNVVGTFNRGPPSFCGFRVSDKAWEGELNLVLEMNRDYGRLEYLTDGTFTSEEQRWQWLEMLANLPSPSDDEYSDDDEEGYEKCEEEKEWEAEQLKEWEAKHVNFILYELLHHPEFMQT